MWLKKNKYYVLKIIEIKKKHISNEKTGVTKLIAFAIQYRIDDKSKSVLVKKIQTQVKKKKKLPGIAYNNRIYI